MRRSILYLMMFLSPPLYGYVSVVLSIVSFLFLYYVNRTQYSM